MNQKTPVSLLQEILVKQNCIPQYEEVHSDLVDYRFKCVVKFGNKQASGYALTKKEAKHKCAQEALEQMGVGLVAAFNSKLNNNNYPLSKSPVTSSAQINYIGTLHEFAAGNRAPNPTYCEKLPRNGLFVVECSFMNFKTEGTAFNKKEAKQQASKNMIDKLQTENVNFGFFQTDSGRTIDMDYSAILKRYDELSITVDKTVTPQADVILPKIEVEIENYTMDDLREKLKEMGHHTSVEVFQSNPYIMVLRIVENSCVIMGLGVTKKEATDDLLNKASTMFQAGFSFKTKF